MALATARVLAVVAVLVRAVAATQEIEPQAFSNVPVDVVGKCHWGGGL